MVSSAMNWAHPMSSHIEILLIFKGNDVVNTLDKDQLDTFLDGDLGLDGLSGPLKAVFVQANYDWLIQALVCCYLPVDSDGYCEAEVSLPLQRFCDTAGPGPDFGAGRIRLACRSQCPISGFKDQMWDPSTVTFSAIKQALEESQGSLLHDFANMPQDNNIDHQISSIKRSLRNEEAASRSQAQQYQQELEKQKLIVERLQNQLADITQKRSTLDEHSLRQENERLKMKVRELQVKLDRLRESRISEQEEEEDSLLLKRMEESDMLSVVFHAGVGHINLQAHQLADYFDDTLAYAANQIDITRHEYTTWLKHHDSPKCVVCDEAIPLIGNPKIFNEDMDIYCDQHKPLD